MEPIAVHLALHGAIVLLIGLLGGLAFSRAIRSAKGEVAWRVVHSGGSMGGVMLLAVAGLIRFLVLPHWGLVLLAASLVVGTYALVAGMVVAAWTGDRGLGRGGSPANRVVHVLYLAGTAASLAGSGMLIVGLAMAL